MRTLIEQPPAHLTSYHDEVGLVAQFILHEIIQSLEETNQIMLLLKKSPKTRPNISKLLKAILELMIQLSGSNDTGSMRLFSRNVNNGTLIKLKNYCAFLVGKVGGTDTYLMEAAERSWIYSLQALDIIRQLNHQLNPTPKELIALGGLIEKMAHCILSVAEQVSQLIVQFRQDENILFFILRFHSKLDNLYGENFCIRLLQKMYPKGKSSLESFLCRKYTQRGFYNQIPEIKRYIAQIYGR
jgi:hypothetical protein